MQPDSGRLGLDFGGGVGHFSLYSHWVMELLFVIILIVYYVDVVGKWSCPLASSLNNMNIICSGYLTG